MEIVVAGDGSIAEPGDDEAMGCRAAWLGALLLAAPAIARADGRITNRDYAIDLYDGVAIGSTASVGMGGTGAALITGTSGTLINPSAMAMRPTRIPGASGS